MLGRCLVFLGFVISALFLILFLKEVSKSLDMSALAEFQGQLTARQKLVREIPPGCQLNERFPASVRQWCDLINQYAQKQGLDPSLVGAMIWFESGGDPEAVSPCGAVGLMQVMPRDGNAATFMCPNGPCFSHRPTSEQLFEPEFNISYGTELLARLIGRHNNLREALKSYGPMDVGYVYADRVLSIYQRYRTP